jgi:hypothetical protein
MSGRCLKPTIFTGENPPCPGFRGCGAFDLRDWIACQRKTPLPLRNGEHVAKYLKLFSDSLGRNLGKSEVAIGGKHHWRSIPHIEFGEGRPKKGIDAVLLDKMTPLLG